VSKERNANGRPSCRPRKARTIVDRFQGPSAGPRRGRFVVRTAATGRVPTPTFLSYVGEHPGVKYPVVMGHESTGVVDSLGEGRIGSENPGSHVSSSIPSSPAGPLRTRACAGGRQSFAA